MHQVGKKDYHYIRMHGQQNIKKKWVVTSCVGILLKEERLKVIMNLNRREDAGN